MSVIDKVAGSLGISESLEDRAKARSSALDVAEPDDWLSQVLDHHGQIDAAFQAVEDAENETERLQAQEWLALLLTGHAVAEESVIYPALAMIGEKGHAETAYSEQASVKMDMAALADLDPASPEYADKLGKIREAVAHHVYEEESQWFIALKRKAPSSDQEKLTQRYDEEFARYTGGEVTA